MNGMAHRKEVVRERIVNAIALLILMLIGGLIPRFVVGLALMLLPGYLIATWFGSRLFQRSSDLTYRRVALGILLLAGLYGMTL